MISYCTVLRNSDFSLPDFRSILATYEISDWLINYEGGFVRRGIIGELLYWIYDNTGWNIPVVITAFNFCTLIVFSVLFVRKWLQFRLSVLILPTFVLLGSFWISHNYMWYRRDVLIFLICLGVFLCYKAFLNGKKIYLVLLEILIVLTVLMHEASVFYMVPIMLVHYFLYNRRNLSSGKSLLRTVLLGLPAAGTFLICSVFKGNKEVADAIWQSWQPMFSQLSADNIEMGMGVKALTWKTLNTFWMHFHTNFLTDCHGIRSIFLWPFVIFSIFYLLVNVNRVRIGYGNGRKPFSLLKYLHILLIVIVFMLPMFTILSCDYQRLFMYCIFTSFLFYFSVTGKMLSVFYNRTASYRIKRAALTLSKGFFAKMWVFLIILLFAGTPFFRFNFEEIFSTSLVGATYNFAKLFLSIIGIQI